MPNLSQDAIEALTAHETDQIFLYTLKCYTDEGPDAPEPLYLVNDNQDIVSGGILHKAVAFNAILPSQSTDGGTRSTKLSIDNVDLKILQFATACIGKKIYVDLAVIRAAAPDVVERGPIRLILRNVTANKQTVSGDLYDFYLYDRNIPEGRYTPKDFPGLF